VYSKLYFPRKSLSNNDIHISNLSLRIIISALIGFTLFACQAPHDNPLDPQSPIYRAPQPPARIVDLGLDSLDGFLCLLSWSIPARAYEYRLYYGSSDWDGHLINDASLYRGELPGIKTVGKRQTVWITIPPGETHAWVMFSISKDGILSDGSDPVIIEAPERDRVADYTVSAHSLRSSQWGDPLDWLSLITSVTIADSDGVDSVWLQKDTLFIGTLSSQRDGLHWQREFYDFELPDYSLEAIVGHDLALHSRDFAGFETTSESFRINRVINQTPLIESPTWPDTLVEPKPVLSWFPYYAEFPFTYSIQIVHNSLTYIRTIIYLDSLIDSDSTSYQVQDSLTRIPGDLLWTVSVVDEFNNEARSSEAKFNIK